MRAFERDWYCLSVCVFFSFWAMLMVERFGGGGGGGGEIGLVCKDRTSTSGNGHVL